MLMLHVAVLLLPLIVALAWYVSVPAVVLDRMVNWTVPLASVVCGDAVSSVVPAVAGVDLLKLIDRPDSGDPLLFPSTVLTVPMATDEPSLAMLAGWNLQASPDAPRGLNTMSAVTELTLAPSLNVMVQVVAKFDLNTNRA